MGKTLSIFENYTLGSCSEMISQLLNENINNGIVFTNSTTSIEPSLIDICIEKHNLKRVLVINWDRNQDKLLNIQKHFQASNK